MNSFMSTHLSKQGDKDDLSEVFKAGARLREMVREALKEEISREHSRSIQKKDYDSPSWPLRQADSVGYQRALDMVIEALQD